MIPRWDHLGTDGLPSEAAPSWGAIWSFGALELPGKPGNETRPPPPVVLGSVDAPQVGGGQVQCTCRTEFTVLDSVSPLMSFDGFHI